MRVVLAVVLLVFVDGGDGDPCRGLVKLIAVSGLVEAVQAEEACILGERAARICGNELGEIGLGRDVVLELVVAQAPVVLDSVVLAGSFREH